MCNVLNEELIDVSNYVEMGYKPIYCSGENNIVYLLINPYPHKLSIKSIEELKSEIKKSIILTYINPLKHHIIIAILL